MSDVVTTAPEPAGLLRRLSAIFYEGLLLVAVLMIASAPLTLLLGITPAHPLFPLLVLYVYGVSFLYLGWFWVRGAQTPAMRVWGIRVERLDGDNLGWRDAAWRYAGTLPYWGLAILAFQAQRHWPAAIAAMLWGGLGIAVSCTLLDRRRRMLQDVISRTRLVRVGRKSAQPAEGNESGTQEDH